MQRRRALAGLGATGIASVAGVASYLALDGTDREFSVDGDEPTVSAPGETTVVVRAGDVDRLGITRHCGNSAVEFDLLDMRVEPKPDAAYQTLPPTWLWDAKRDVTVHIPVSVPADADGTCEYGVAAAGGDDEAVEESFTITVDDA